MTHDKLLKKINWWKGAYVNRNNCKRCIKYLNTLRAVVELHQPTPEGRYPKVLCQGCSMTEVNLYVDYPCQTIRVIEKELS